MIEKYQNKIASLESLGSFYYQKSINEKYSSIDIASINIKYGTSLTDTNRNKGLFPLLASNGISDYVDIHNSYNVVTFGCRGTLGNVFYNKGECFILNTAFYIENYKEYGNLYFALKHEKGLTLYQSGAVQPQITIDSIKDVVLKFPTNSKLNNVLDLIWNNTLIIKKLKEIKQLLLSKYF